MAAISLRPFALSIAFAVLTCQAFVRPGGGTPLASNAAPLEVTPASFWWVGESLLFDELKDRPWELLRKQIDNLGSGFAWLPYGFGKSRRSPPKAFKFYELHRAYLL
ncbi:MAG TPA: hypothetical protein VNL14_09100 [Candidatus Acidoferrales bacterium]|nr:hypothetical protein [Candidatus Acidoferrales bacterium]